MLIFLHVHVYAVVIANYIGDVKCNVAFHKKNKKTKNNTIRLTEIMNTGPPM